MDIGVLAFFKKENLLYVKWHLSGSLMASYISKFVEHYYLLTVRQTVLLKIIYDFTIEISFMEKYKFLISKNSTQIRIFNCYSCETVWVKVLLSKGWMVAVRNYSIQILQWKKQTGGGG